MAAHIAYIKAEAGIDHVGIGGDFDGVELLPEGLEDVSTYPTLIEVRGTRCTRVRARVGLWGWGMVMGFHRC